MASEAGLGEIIAHARNMLKRVAPMYCQNHFFIANLLAPPNRREGREIRIRRSRQL